MTILDKIITVETKKKEELMPYKQGYKDGYDEGFDCGFKKGFKKAKLKYGSKDFYDPLGEEEI